MDGATWQKKTKSDPLRGFTDDNDTIPANSRLTAVQKVLNLELMLGQIANFVPIISRNTIVKNSTSMNSIWQAIRLHFGFQSTGGHFLDFNSIKLEIGERPEDLYQRLISFTEDNLLSSEGSIRHHGAVPTEDEELTPTVENIIVLTWLRLIHADLPGLVKQRYGTELRSQTLASLKPEISLALDSLLNELEYSCDVKVLRSAYQQQSKFTKSKKYLSSSTKSCPICKLSGKSNYDHFLSTCKYLPEKDKKYLKSRQTVCIGDQSDDSDNDSDLTDDVNNSSPVSTPITSCRVSTEQSPYFKAFYYHNVIKVTLDTGAEVSMIRASTAHKMNAPIKRSNQTALQADGVTPLNIVGETHIVLCRDNINLTLDALVVENLDVDILAGIPFMRINDIMVRPAKQQILISDKHSIIYGSNKYNSNGSSIRRTHAHVLKAIATNNIWPGEYIEINLPDNLDPDQCFAIEPRNDMKQSKNDGMWPQPNIIESVNGKIRIINETNQPQSVKKNEHFCQILDTIIPPLSTSDTKIDVNDNNNLQSSVPCSELIKLNPDNVLTHQYHQKFRKLLNDYSDVFNTSIGVYNGYFGPFEATVNMGPVEPPQRKGRVPQYARDKLMELQSKCDELEKQGILRRPEDINMTVEYLSPSFLVKKSNGGHRLVTAFSDVGKYSKPQPSLMPNVDAILRQVAQWKYIIVTDLTSAFYQIPLSRQSMKYCGISTPFKGVRVYTRSAMGMPGSETALEELMCRVLGDCLEDGIVTKLADDLYCGGNTEVELLDNFNRVLLALSQSNLRLSPTKTIIAPKSTTLLGWIWKDGELSADPHRVSVLSSCPVPATARELRSYLGAYNILGRVIQNCSQILSPLQDMVAGSQSKDKLVWSDEQLDRFTFAQKQLLLKKTITLPRPDDQLWIVTDGSTSKCGLGSTLYISRNNRTMLAGFFSAKMKKYQVTWLPCEVEALSIATAIKHFSPYIIQSSKQTCVLTDSKPCVQAIEKLNRGEFSSSPRVTAFLSTASRYQVTLQHLSGSVNLPSGYSSRNANECTNHQCQICSFIAYTEESVVRSTQANTPPTKVPFTTRSAWLQIQSECPDLRRTHSHLKQGTRPSRKQTKIKDVKRYLNCASIARDGLLVINQTDPLSARTEQIIVPRSVIDGLVTALHIKLDHPSKHQLYLVMKRHFFALDIRDIIKAVSDNCHTCVSLMTFPSTITEQSTSDSPNAVGTSFAADIIKRNKQLILVLRETTTSYTAAQLINDEKHTSVRDALIIMCSSLVAIDGPCASIRVDPAPSFVALQNNDSLKQFNITLEVGRTKNINKNPVAEKAIMELEAEFLRQDPPSSTITPISLAISIARLNSRIRSNGLSARELWTQRDQYTQSQLPIDDKTVIDKQKQQRERNHKYSERSKEKSGRRRPSVDLSIGDLVYLRNDNHKHAARDRYLVNKIEDDWCYILKFSGNQLRSKPYKVLLKECYAVPSNIHTHTHTHAHNYNDSSSESDTEYEVNRQCQWVAPPVIPNAISKPVEVNDKQVSSTSQPICKPAAPVSFKDRTFTRTPRARKPPTRLKDYILQ